jgi:hypothetical protein
MVVVTLYLVVSCGYHAKYSISFQRDAFAAKTLEILRSTGAVEGIPLAKEWQPKKLGEIDWKYFSCESRLKYGDDFFGLWTYYTPYKDNTYLVISIVDENSIGSLFFLASPEFSLYDVKLLAMESPSINKPQ